MHWRDPPVILSILGANKIDKTLNDKIQIHLYCIEVPISVKIRLLVENKF